jgi:hypothetical protein
MPLIGARATASRGYFGGGTKPGAPVITSSTQGVSSLSIAFTAPVFNGGLLISRYEYAVSINNSTWTTFATATSGTNPPTSPVTISGLTNGQAYYVKLRAVNGLGFGPESNVWSTTTTPRTTPDAPTLTSVTRGYRRLTAAFTAPAFDGGSEILDYEYSINGGSTWAPMGQATTTDYAITGLTDFTEYNVRVRAVNIAGGGAHSATVSAYTAGVTNAPTSLTASSNGVFQSVLTWTAPDSNASAITDYVVQYSLNNSTWTTFSDGVSATTGATVTSLSAATTYYYRVASINAVGQSGWSNVPSAATAGVPSQVDTPTSSSGDRSFTISWSAPGTGGSAITSYSVQYSTNGGSSWSTAETFTSANTEFTNRSKTWAATNGTSYTGRVLATNAVGSGAYSAASTARTPTFAAPSLTANGSYTSSGSPGTRRVTWSIDPTDISGSTATTGTTTYVYLQWTRTASNTDPGTAEELIGTYTGNQAVNGEYLTYIPGTGTVIPKEGYRLRAVQYDGAHAVGTAWVSIDIADYVYYDTFSWQDNGAVDLYTTGTWTLTNNGYDGVAKSGHVSGSSMPGVSTDTEGSVQYNCTSIKIFVSSSASASTTTRYFVVDFSGTSTTLDSTATQTMTGVANTSSASHTWTGAGNTSMEYTWTAPSLDYGNPGAGRVRVRKLGSSTSPSISVYMTAKGNKRTRIRNINGGSY